MRGLFVVLVGSRSARGTIKECIECISQLENSCRIVYTAYNSRRSDSLAQCDSPTLGCQAQCNSTILGVVNKALPGTCQYI